MPPVLRGRPAGHAPALAVAAMSVGEASDEEVRHREADVGERERQHRLTHFRQFAPGPCSVTLA